MGLVDIVGDLIEDCETLHHPLPEATGVQALKFLRGQRCVDFVFERCIGIICHPSLPGSCYAYA